MNAGRLPLFCDTALAERIERAEAQLIAEASQAARRRGAGTAGLVIGMAGGVASFAEPDSPFNKVAGLGFGGVPDAAELDEIEQARPATWPVTARSTCPGAVPISPSGDPTGPRE